MAVSPPLAPQPAEATSLVHWSVVSIPIPPPEIEVDRAEVSAWPAAVRLPARVMEYWHLLSLDAPTVAVVWSWAFASAAGVALHPISAALLGLATWLLYVGDRLLDGLRFSQLETQSNALRERHHFHARHRSAFLVVASPALCMLAWLVCIRMDRTPRVEDLILSAAAAIYLLLVHLPPPPASWRRFTKLQSVRFLSKEAAVAIIFSIACIIPAWSRQITMHGWLVCLGVPFALLCWLNCNAIETWETGKSILPPITSTIGENLRGACVSVAATALLLALVAATQGHRSVTAVLLCIAMSASLLLGLDRLRHRMTALQLRAAADAVLLTPTAFLLIKYLSHRL